MRGRRKSRIGNGMWIVTLSAGGFLLAAKGVALAIAPRAGVLPLEVLALLAMFLGTVTFILYVARTERHRLVDRLTWPVAMLAVFLGITELRTAWQHRKSEMRDNTEMRLTALQMALWVYYAEKAEWPADVGGASGSGTALTRSILRSDAATTRLRIFSGCAAGDAQAVAEDSYGREIRYTRHGGSDGGPVLISAGPDGRFGNKDDIRREVLYPSP